MSAQEHWTSQFEELGAVDYLNKPFDMNDLLTKVAAYRR
jgi:DNA-binding response OmpR family regulator